MRRVGRSSALRCAAAVHGLAARAAERALRPGFSPPGAHRRHGGTSWRQCTFGPPGLHALPGHLSTSATPCVDCGGMEETLRCTNTAAVERRRLMWPSAATSPPPASTRDLRCACPARLPSYCPMGGQQDRWAAQLQLLPLPQAVRRPPAPSADDRRQGGPAACTACASMLLAPCLLQPPTAALHGSSSCELSRAACSESARPSPSPPCLQTRNRQLPNTRPPAYCPRPAPCRSVGLFIGALCAAPLHIFFASAYGTVKRSERDPLAMAASKLVSAPAAGRGCRPRGLLWGLARGLACCEGLLAAAPRMPAPRCRARMRSPDRRPWLRAQSPSLVNDGRGDSAGEEAPTFVSGRVPAPTASTV